MGAAGAITGLYAQSSSAIAQDQVTEPTIVSVAPAPDSTEAEDIVPVFVAKETVQTLPVEPDYSSPRAPASTLAQLVAQTDTEDTLSRELQCLAGAIYFESRGEPLAGQLAVGQVIVNRTESGQFPADYCGVVYQRSQFSFVRGGSMPPIKTGSTAWRQAKAIAHIVHHDLWDSEVGDSLYFHARHVRPAWASRKVARAQISRHLFYR